MQKRYYWMKLKEDFFEADTIQWLEEQPRGREFILFYLKLCLKALKSEGLLIRQVGQKCFPYDEKRLSELTRTDRKTVRQALAALTEIGLIEEMENGGLLLPEIGNMVGSETEKAERMRRLRQSRREAAEGNNVTYGVSQETEHRYTEIEIEKEKGTEQEHLPYGDTLSRRMELLEGGA